MDVVYTIKYAKVNEELVYSLRSLCNIPHDKVYFIGGCPYNLNHRYITWIPAATLATKYKTTTHNLEIAANLPKLSEEFIWMNDDFYILQKIKDPVAELNLNKGSLHDSLNEFIKRNGICTAYMTGAEQTMSYMKTLGIQNPLSYELHIPFIYNKSCVKTMLALKDIRKVPILYKRSVYGNLYYHNSTKTTDVKILRASKVDYTEWDKRKFLSSSDITWDRVKPYLEKKFKDKSIYEL